jgi:hypothetical protein
MKRPLLITALLAISLCGRSQDDFRYQAPPKDILDLVLAKPTPGVSIDDKAEWMLLLERSDYPSIDELAQPELRIAGLRINPANFSPSRSPSSNNIRIRNVKTKAVYDIDGLPKNLRASSVRWSPDQKKFAFVHSGPNAVDLYVVDVLSHKAKKINSTALNTVLGEPFQWASNNEILYKAVSR